MTQINNMRRAIPKLSGRWRRLLRHLELTSFRFNSTPKLETLAYRLRATCLELSQMMCRGDEVRLPLFLVLVEIDLLWLSLKEHQSR